jgi:myo-inositol-1-phosphate synthase
VESFFVQLNQLREALKDMIRTAIAGIGNCAGALVEGISWYKQSLDRSQGLLFAKLGGYSVADIAIVAAFDIADGKVGLHIRDAIYQPPNNFVRIPNIQINENATVLRGPTLDGNPPDLQRFVRESSMAPVNIAATLRECEVDVFVNLLPTGSVAATEFYAAAALEASCSFVNCIPTPLAQRLDVQSQFAERKLVVLGDDIKSQVGTTILHRALLALLERRGAALESTSQINIGGNTDFANFVSRGELKLISKRKSLERYCDRVPSHIGHHYDPTRGSYKSALIEVEATVFGGSRVRISTRLESDDKPNSAGSVVDLIRIAKAGSDRGQIGTINEACALYMKSPPVPLDDIEALELVERNWSDKKSRIKSEQTHEVRNVKS